VITRKLYGNNKLIFEYTQSLTKTEELSASWETKYNDNTTGHKWLKYTIDDHGFEANLMMISPAPTTDELIDIALNSEYDDEASAAANRLFIEEKNENKDFRKKLIDKLTQIDFLKLDNQGKIRMEEIIRTCELTNRVNRRDIIGKHLSIIQKDADYFNNIAEQAEKILSIIK
jgi:hypothetical protein